MPKFVRVEPGYRGEGNLIRVQEEEYMGDNIVELVREIGELRRQMLEKDIQRDSRIATLESALEALAAAREQNYQARDETVPTQTDVDQHESVWDYLNCETCGPVIRKAVAEDPDVLESIIKRAVKADPEMACRVWGKCTGIEVAPDDLEQGETEYL